MDWIWPPIGDVIDFRLAILLKTPGRPLSRGSERKWGSRLVLSDNSPHPRVITCLSRPSIGSGITAMRAGSVMATTRVAECWALPQPQVIQIPGVPFASVQGQVKQRRLTSNKSNYHVLSVNTAVGIQAVRSPTFISCYSRLTWRVDCNRSRDISSRSSPCQQVGGSRDRPNKDAHDSQRLGTMSLWPRRTGASLNISSKTAHAQPRQQHF